LRKAGEFARIQAAGGKVRTAVPLYTYASANELPELEDQVRKAMGAGYRHVRVQLAVPGFSGYGVNAKTSDEIQRARPSGVAPSPVFEPTPYVNNTVKMFDYRSENSIVPFRRLGSDTIIVEQPT